jgi:hypothetical protein
MSTSSSLILTILLRLIWSVLSGDGWLNPRFRFVIPSEQRLSELANLLGITFCPGLLAVL